MCKCHLNAPVVSQQRMVRGGKNTANSNCYRKMSPGQEKCSVQEYSQVPPTWMMRQAVISMLVNESSAKQWRAEYTIPRYIRTKHTNEIESI